MSRPQRNRKICSEPKFRRFAPVGNGTVMNVYEDPSEQTEATGEASLGQMDATCEDILLNVDEYEAIRLIDFVGLTQEQCARHMGVARTTVTEIYDKARHKIAIMLIEGKKLRIDGGNYSVCGGTHPDGDAICSKCLSVLGISQ
ncbi:MAG: DUF134 domain-containing protein [Lachnospiraceae bacterium]|nr:DUF134 domain-containing protein [Lachnospiraceae bacterium]